MTKNEMRCLLRFDCKDCRDDSSEVGVSCCTIQCVLSTLSCVAIDEEVCQECVVYTVAFPKDTGMKAFPLSCAINCHYLEYALLDGCIISRVLGCSVSQSRSALSKRGVPFVYHGMGVVNDNHEFLSIETMQCQGIIEAICSFIQLPYYRSLCLQPHFA